VEKRNKNVLLQKITFVKTGFRLTADKLLKLHDFCRSRW